MLLCLKGEPSCPIIVLLCHDNVFIVIISYIACLLQSVSFCLRFIFGLQEILSKIKVAYVMTVSLSHSTPGTMSFCTID